MPAQASGHIRKYLRKRKFKKASVLRVLAAVMENQAAAAAAGASNASGSSGSGNANSDYHNEFFNTGRIGRRNALPDILGYNCATTSTADLPLRLSALTTNDSPTPSTSGASNSSSVDRNAPSTSASTSASTSSQATCSSSTQPVGESMNPT